MTKASFSVELMTAASPVYDPDVCVDLAARPFALIRHSATGRLIIWGMYATETNAKAAKRRAERAQIVTR